MAANVFFNALQAIDANGDAVSGAKVRFFDSGTTNLQTVYTDAGLGTAHPDPLVANGAGVFPAVFQAGSTDIKVTMTDASDVALPGYPLDPAVLQGTAGGASSVSFSPTSRIIATDTQAAIEEVDGDVKVIEDARTIEKSVYTTAGTTTTYTISATGFTVYATGNRFWVRANATNTGAATINVESVGSKNIKRYDGAGVIQDLAADDFAAGSEYLLHYDGTQFVIISERLTKATFTDATTGTQNTKYMTALRTKQAIDQFSGGGLTFIDTQDLADDPTADFTGFDATKYDSYEFHFQNVIPATDSVDLVMRTSTDGGVSYDAAVADYDWATNEARAGGSTSGDGSAVAALDTYIQLNGNTPIGSAAGEYGVSGELDLSGPHLAADTMCNYRISLIGNDSTIKHVTGSGRRKSAADVDAVRFLMTSGNLESGTITMYGVVNA